MMTWLVRSGLETGGIKVDGKTLVATPDGDALCVRAWSAFHGGEWRSTVALDHGYAHAVPPAPPHLLMEWEVAGAAVTLADLREAGWREATAPETKAFMGW